MNYAETNENLASDNPSSATSEWTQTRLNTKSLFVATDFRSGQYYDF